MFGIVPTGDPAGYQSNYGGYSGGFWDKYSPDWGETGRGKDISNRDVYWWKPGGWEDWGVGVVDPFSGSTISSSSSSIRKRKADAVDPGKQIGVVTSNKRPSMGLPGVYVPFSSDMISPISGDLPQLTVNKSKMSGRAIHGFPGPFRTKKVNAILGEEMHESRKIYLKRLTGRICPYAKQISANKYKPLTMLFGDVLAENDTTTAVEEAQMAVAGDTSANKDNYALSTSQVSWGTNRYGDICVANCMSSQDASGSAGVADSVINKHFLLTNIWSGVSNTASSGQRMSLPALAAINGSEYSWTQTGASYASQMFPAVTAGQAECPSGLEALFKYESEIVLNNPMNFACQVEAYLIVPKYPNYSDAPSLFWENSEKERAYEGHPLAAGVDANVVLQSTEQYRPPAQENFKNDLSRSPTQSVAFNNRYRVLDKKTIVIGSGHTTKICSSVPWSLIKRDIIEGVPTLAGVTHFVWLRFCSPQLYNNDSHALVNTNGTILVQQFEKIQVKPIDPVFVPKIYNFIKFASENSTNIVNNQMINPDGNTVTPGAKLNMDVA